MGFVGTSECINKKCRKCGIDKSATEFYHNSSAPDGLKNTCKCCVEIQRRAYIRAHTEKRSTDNKRYHDKHKAQTNERQTRRRRGLRKEMIEAYGGKCECPACPETNPAFLNLHHKNGDGAEHRARFGGHAERVWLDIKKRGWPKDDYGLLCWNCNCATRYGGGCPHVELRSQDIGKVA